MKHLESKISSNCAWWSPRRWWDQVGWGRPGQRWSNRAEGKLPSHGLQSQPFSPGVISLWSCLILSLWCYKWKTTKITVRWKRSWRLCSPPAWCTPWSSFPKSSAPHPGSACCACISFRIRTVACNKMAQVSFFGRNRIYFHLNVRWNSVDPTPTSKNSQYSISNLSYLRAFFQKFPEFYHVILSNSQK